MRILSVQMQIYKWFLRALPRDPIDQEKSNVMTQLSFFMILLSHHNLWCHFKLMMSDKYFFKNINTYFMKHRLHDDRHESLFT
jgi:hypothetical protein